ncbi:MAG: glutamine hydrolyzing CTP synthase [Candidatus Woesearchaeota archaeon]
MLQNSNLKNFSGSKKKKFIFISGGVISGVGKGVATASIAKIMKEFGFKATCIKIDPYINVDAGTLRPTEHGEVWVTFDGGETDQDLGNYERFTHQNLPKKNNITTGQIYEELIRKERSGLFLGKTVQIIPHFIDEVKKRILDAGKDFEIILVEIGGTVGDYENMPFLFAAKSLEKDFGKENIVYVLVSYLPTPGNIGEMKTKPTQQAIKMLSETGIYPDIVIARAAEPLDDVRKEKIERYANINKEFIISAPDVDNIYFIPLNFEREMLGAKILKRLNLKPRKRANWSAWKRSAELIEKSDRVAKIAIVGKYFKIGNYNLKDSYISVIESLKHAAAYLGARVCIEEVSSQDLESNEIKLEDILSRFDGVLIPGGFGSQGVSGKINAIRYARENRKPFLGLCFGMQLAIIEFCRNVLGMRDADSVEINPRTENPVITILPEQQELLKNNAYGATMRLGGYAAVLDRESIVYMLYKEFGRIKNDMKTIEFYLKDKDLRFRVGYIPKNSEAVLERHRHRYEVNPKYVELLEKNGVRISGCHFIDQRKKLVEFIELKEHPFFVATQSHPEFSSKFLSPSPLFVGFLRACLSSNGKNI